MSTIRHRLIEEARRRLNLARPGNVPEFQAYAVRSVNSENLPFAVLYPADEDVAPVTNRAGPLVQRIATIVVEVRSAAADPMAELDAALDWITSVLGGVRLSVAGIPNLTHEIMETKIQWRVAAKDLDYIAVFVRLEVPYTTAVRNQSTVS